MTKYEWNYLIAKHSEEKVKKAMLDAIYSVQTLFDPLDDPAVQREEDCLLRDEEERDADRD